MSDIRIDVTAYSGYRGEETPRSFILDNRKIEIVEILERRVEEELHDKSRRRFFHIRGNDGLEYVLYFDYRGREWFLRGRHPGISGKSKKYPS